MNMEWMDNSQVNNDYHSLLVHFERNGKPPCYLWSNEKGELVTHIPCPREAGKGDHAAYDLLGRKVMGKPGHNIYTIDGQKRVAR